MIPEGRSITPETTNCHSPKQHHIYLFCKMKQIKVPKHQNTLNKPHPYGLIYLQLIPVPALKRQGIKPGISKTRECDKRGCTLSYSLEGIHHGEQSHKDRSVFSVMQKKTKM